MQSISQKVKGKKTIMRAFQMPLPWLFKFCSDNAVIANASRFFYIKVCNKNEDIALSLGFSITFCSDNKGIAKILGVFFFWVDLYTIMKVLHYSKHFAIVD